MALFFFAVRHTTMNTVMKKFMVLGIALSAFLFSCEENSDGNYYSDSDSTQSPTSGGDARNAATERAASGDSGNTNGRAPEGVNAQGDAQGNSGGINASGGDSPQDPGSGKTNQGTGNEKDDSRNSIVRDKNGNVIYNTDSIGRGKENSVKY